jgi:ATP-dependent Clp protease ATP-binding subunit ClpB
VFVGEPTVEDTISILRGLKEKYELHHGVRITDAAIVAAATLSNRYITDRFLPDKAIDLIDEAASRLRMEVDSKPEELDELDRRIIQLKIEREALKKEKDPASKERLKALEAELAELEEQSAALTTRWQAEKEKIAGAAEAQGAARRRGWSSTRRSAPGDLARAGELQYGRIPRWRSSSRKRPRSRARRCSARRSPPRTSPVVVALDRHPGRADARRRAREAAAMERSSASA